MLSNKVINAKLGITGNHSFCKFVLLILFPVKLPVIIHTIPARLHCLHTSFRHRFSATCFAEHVRQTVHSYQSANCRASIGL